MPNTSNMSFLSRPFTFDRVVRLLIMLALLIGGLWIINKLSSVLLPFLIAWLIAYILEPFVQRNRKVLRCKGRLIPVLLTLLEVVLVIIVLCVAFLPSIFDEMHQVAVLLKNYADSSMKVPFLPTDLHDFLLKHIDFRHLSDSLTKQGMDSFLDLVGSFLSSGISLILSFFDVVVVILYVIFIMLDYDKLIAGFRRIMPPKMSSLMSKIIDDMTSSMNLYFRGQSLIAFLVGVLFSIGFLIVGLPLAVVMGMFIGLLNMVPYLQLVSIPITTLLCLVCSVQEGIDFWPLWWSVMLVYIIVQSIQDLFLTPKIMGKQMGLNPAIILFSLSLWGAILGFIGLIIALPLTTMLMAYYNEYIVKTYRNTKTTNAETESPETADNDKDHKA